MKADVMVTHYGTMVGFWPITAEAKAWANAHVVAPVKDLTKGFYTAPATAKELALHMAKYGLKVILNGAKEVN